MTAAKAFDVRTGQTKHNFHGHYENVNCCWYNSTDQELYTGADDTQILVWSPSKLNPNEVDQWKKGHIDAVDQDN